MSESNADNADNEAITSLAESYPEETVKWLQLRAAVEGAVEAIWADSEKKPSVIVAAQFGDLPYPVHASNMRPCREVQFAEVLSDLCEVGHDLHHGIDPKTGELGSMSEIKTYEEVKNELPEEVRKQVEAMIAKGEVRIEDIRLVSSPTTNDLHALPTAEEVEYPSRANGFEGLDEEGAN